jgi:hypothetical protein
LSQKAEPQWQLQRVEVPEKEESVLLAAKLEQIVLLLDPEDGAPPINQDLAGWKTAAHHFELLVLPNPFQAWVRQSPGECPWDLVKHHQTTVPLIGAMILHVMTCRSAAVRTCERWALKVSGACGAGEHFDAKMPDCALVAVER